MNGVDTARIEVRVDGGDGFALDVHHRSIMELFLLHKRAEPDGACADEYCRRMRDLLGRCVERTL